jgi:ribosome-associated protein
MPDEIGPEERRYRLTSAGAHTNARNNDQRQTMTDEELRLLVAEVVAAAEDKLGQRTEAFFVGDVLGIADWFVVTSGANGRQVRAIVENIEEQLVLAGGPKPIRIEGKEHLSWVLMDYGWIIVHVFDEESRDYYDLERLWADVPRLADVSPASEGF